MIEHLIKNLIEKKNRSLNNKDKASQYLNQRKIKKD